MTMRFLCAALCVASGVIAQRVIDLSGNDWTLQNLPLNISIPGSVPSQAHLDLYAAQVIGNPYADHNILRYPRLTPLEDTMG